MAQSAGINIIERDTTTYTTASSDTMLAIVGYASKGPIGVPTLVSSKAEFLETFGVSPTLSPYSALAAMRALDRTNQVLFYRIAAATGSDIAATEAEAVVLPSLQGYQEFAANSALVAMVDTLSTGEYDPAKIGSFNISIDGGTAQLVEIDPPASGNWTNYQVYTAIKNAIDVLPALYGKVRVELVGGKIRFTSTAYKSATVASTVALTAGTTSATLFDFLTGRPAAAAVDGVVANGATRTGFSIKSLEKGSSTNLISVVKSSRKSSTYETDQVMVHKIEVLLNGKVKETYDDVDVLTTFSPSTAGTFMKVINDDSEYIVFGPTADAKSYPTIFPDGTYVLGSSNYGDADIAYDSVTNDTEFSYKPGTDGIPSTEGDKVSIRTQFLAALRPDGELANTELYDYHIMVTPDTYDAAIQNLVVSLAESRKDFIYIADAPYGYTYKESVDWHNGADAGVRDTPLNSSYAALYAPWVKVTNVFSGEQTWVPPSVVVAEKYIELDKAFGPWAAPAGDTRGILTGVTDYEYSPSKAQRDEMCGDPNTVNPIVYFNTKGIEIYGEKTCLRTEGAAMSRVHVRRLAVYVSKVLKKVLEGFIYEANSAATWAKASERINAKLDAIRNKGGLSNYQVIIDSTNNDTDSILQNKMNVVVRLQPFGVIETIEINLNVDMTGASIV